MPNITLDPLPVSFRDVLFVASISRYNHVRQLSFAASRTPTFHRQEEKARNKPVYDLSKRRLRLSLRKLQADIIIALRGRRNRADEASKKRHPWMSLANEAGCSPIISTLDTRSKAPLVTLQVAMRCCYANSPDLTEPIGS